MRGEAIWDPFWDLHLVAAKSQRIQTLWTLNGQPVRIHGDKQFSLLVVASDFDAPIVIGTPPADQIK